MTCLRLILVQIKSAHKTALGNGFQTQNFTAPEPFKCHKQIKNEHIGLSVSLDPRQCGFFFFEGTYSSMLHMKYMNKPAVMLLGELIPKCFAERGLEEVSIHFQVYLCVVGD